MYSIHIMTVAGKSINVVTTTNTTTPNNNNNNNNKTHGTHTRTNRCMKKETLQRYGIKQYTQTEKLQQIGQI